MFGIPDVDKLIAEIKQAITEASHSAVRDALSQVRGMLDEYQIQITFVKKG